MAEKIPRKFRKPVKEKFFKKKVLRRIHLDRDRTFVEEAFTQDSDGRYHLREELSAEERKRLARILKEIKKNRGLLKFGRLLVVLLILGGVILFNILLKDRLLEEAGERFLESTFQAKSDIEELRFQPLQGRISIAGLTIADRDAPMENLIDLGETDLSIETLELLKGNLVINRMGALNIAFGTERESSGALEGTPAPESGEPDENLEERAQRATEDTLAALGITDLAVDPEAMVREYAESLRSRQVVEEIIGEAEATREVWSARIEDTADRVTAVRDDVVEMSELRPESIDSIPTALRTYEEVTAVTAQVEELYATVAESQSEFQRELARINASRDRIEAAIEADYQALRDRIPSLDIDAGAFAMGTMRVFLESFLGSTYERAVALIDRFERLRDQVPEGDRGPGRGGFDVPFPSVTYPRFYLQVAEATGDHAGTALQVRLEHLSSDPELTDEPVGVAYTQSTGELMAEVSGIVDLREGSEEKGEFTLSVGGLRPSLPAAARDLGFETLSGRATLSTAALLSRDGSLQGRLDLQAREVTLTPQDSAGRTATILSEALGATEEVAAEIEYRIEEGRLTGFTGSTTLVRALRERAEQLVAELVAQVERRLRSELDSLIENELAPYREATAALEALSDRSLEELREAETYREIVQEQRQAMEARVAELRRQAEERARAEVEKQVEEARKQVDEARDRIEEEARDRIRVPSFGN